MPATGRAREWPSIPRRLPDDKKMTHWAVEVTRSTAGAIPWPRFYLQG